MRLAVYYGKDNFCIEERPVPCINRGEILMQVEACGICGTDVLDWYRRMRIPCVLGHEATGVIVEVGEGVRGYEKGMRIFASHHVPCGVCSWCLDGHETVCETLRKTNFDPGGFSQFVRLPSLNVEKGLIPLPEDLSFEEATFIEPLACVVRGQRILGGISGKIVLVLGTGISGLLHIQLAKLRRAKLVMGTDISPYRRKMAEVLGADVVWDGNENIEEQVKEFTKGRLADIVILATGAEKAIRESLSLVERGGKILFFSATDEGVKIPLPVNEVFWRNEVTLISSYAGNYLEHLEALELIYQKKIRVKEMVTHRLPLEKIGEGFRLVREAKESIKVIIEPNK